MLGAQLTAGRRDGAQRQPQREALGGVQGFPRPPPPSPGRVLLGADCSAIRSLDSLARQAVHAFHVRACTICTACQQREQLRRRCPEFNVCSMLSMASSRKYCWLVVRAAEWRQSSGETSAATSAAFENSCSRTLLACLMCSVSGATCWIASKRLLQQTADSRLQTRRGTRAAAV